MAYNQLWNGDALPPIQYVDDSDLTWGINAQITCSTVNLINQLSPAHLALGGTTQVIKLDNTSFTQTTTAFTGESILGFSSGITLQKQGDFVILLCDGSTTIKVLGGNFWAEGKLNVIATPTVGDLPTITSAGQLIDSGYSIATIAGSSTTTIPTSAVVTNQINTAITSAKSFRGGYDASTNLYPATGGSGTAGAINAGDIWDITVAGTLGTTPVILGNTITALVNIPGQTNANWNIIQSGVDSVNSQTGQITIAGTTNEINVSSASGTITLSTPQAIAITSTPTFASETLTANTNQLVLGTTNTQTVTMASQTSSHTFTLPNANSNTVQPLSSATSHQVLQYIDATGTQNLYQVLPSDILNYNNTPQTTNFTAVINTMYAVNSTSSGFTITIPITSIPNNSQIIIYDSGGHTTTNNIIISNGSSTITTIANNYQYLILVYNSVISSWQVTNQSNFDANGYMYINPIPSATTPNANQIVNWAYITSQYANLAPFNSLEVYVNGATGSDTSGKGTIFSPFATLTKAYAVVSGSGTVLTDTATYSASQTLNNISNVLTTTQTNGNLWNYKVTQSANITISGTSSRISYQGFQFSVGSAECITQTSSQGIMNFQNCGFVTTGSSIITMGANVTSNMFNYINWCDFTSCVATGGYINFANNTSNTFTATTTSGSTTLTSVSISLNAGQFISGTGIKVGTVIVTGSSGTYIMSLPATASGSSVTIYKPVITYVNNSLGFRANIGNGHLIVGYNNTLGENGITAALTGNTQYYYELNTPLITSVTTYANMLSQNFTNFANGGFPGGYQTLVTADSTASNNGLWQCIAYPYTGTASAWMQITNSIPANIAGGVAGAIPYQSATNVTGFSAAGTSGQLLTSAGTSAPTWTSKNTTPTGSNVAQWDGNSNLSANNFLTGLNSITTSGGGTILSVTSQQIQRFTGTNTQTISLPNATSLPTGFSFTIQNESTGAITVNNNISGLVVVMPAASDATVVLVVNGSQAGTWHVNNSSTGGGTSTPTANSLVKWDANKNLSANNFINGYTSTVTSSTPVALTSSSTGIQVFTGSTAQTVTLPTYTSLTQGMQYIIQNQSTALLTLNTFSSAQVVIVPSNTDTTLKLVGASDAASSWYVGHNLSIDTINTPYTSSNTVATQLSMWNITSPATATLPAASSYKGQIFKICNAPAPTSTATLTVNAISTLQLPPGNSCIVESDGTSWQVIVAPSSTINVPMMSVYQNVNQYITANTTATIQFQVKEFDTNTCFNNTGSTVTLNGLSVLAYAFCPNVAGYYQINAGCRTASYTSGEFTTLLTKNTVFYKQGVDVPASSGVFLSTLSCIVYLNGTGDNIQIQLFSLNAVTLQAAPNYVWFNAAYVGNGQSSLFSASATPVAASLSQWDTNSNLNANNFLSGFATTVTAAGTTTLTVASPQIQRFTGSTTQTVTLPNAISLPNGFSFTIQNESTGAITVNNNSNALVILVEPLSDMTITLAVNGSQAGTWHTPKNGVWTTYTPVITAPVTNPTYSGCYINGAYSVVGKIMYLDFCFSSIPGISVTPGIGTYIISLPSGYSINTSIVSAFTSGANYSDGTTIGLGVMQNGNSVSFGTVSVKLGSNTGVSLYISTASTIGVWTSSVGSLVTNMLINFTAQIPIN